MKKDYKAEDESELAALLSGGDTRAFTELYNRCSPLVLAYARRMLQDELLAGDVMQDSFIILWEKREGLDTKRSLIPYLFGIARRRALAVMRESKGFQDYLNSLQKVIEAYESSPEENLIHQERMDIIELEISRLPERMRSIFQLIRTGEYSHREIAEQFNVSPGAIKDQVYHAKQKLRGNLQRLFSFFF